MHDEIYVLEQQSMESRVIFVGLAWVTAFRMVWLYALTEEEDLRFFFVFQLGSAHEFYSPNFIE